MQMPAPFISDEIPKKLLDCPQALQQLARGYIREINPENVDKIDRKALIVFGSLVVHALLGRKLPDLDFLKTDILGKFQTMLFDKINPAKNPQAPPLFIPMSRYLVYTKLECVSEYADNVTNICNKLGKTLLLFHTGHAVQGQLQQMEKEFREIAIVIDSAINKFVMTHPISVKPIDHFTILQQEGSMPSSCPVLLQLLDCPAALQQVGGAYMKTVWGSNLATIHPKALQQLGFLILESLLGRKMRPFVPTDETPLTPQVTNIGYFFAKEILLCGKKAEGEEWEKDLQCLPVTGRDSSTFTEEDRVVQESEILASQELADLKGTPAEVLAKNQVAIQEHFKMICDDIQAVNATGVQDKIGVDLCRYVTLANSLECVAEYKEELGNIRSKLLEIESLVQNKSITALEGISRCKRWINELEIIKDEMEKEIISFMKDQLDQPHGKNLFK